MAVVVVAGIGWFSLSGRLVGLQYTNVPVVHPYPPQGYFVNPFTGDPRDLINAAEAATVKADLFNDGQIELEALAQGNAAKLSQAATGNFLARVTQVVAANNTRGVVEQEQHHFDSVIVGRLADPVQPSITWCVEERASGLTTYVSKSTGRTVSTQSFHTRARFWLARVGDHYLIADAEITDLP
jgi:hypothetical protein